MSLLRMLYTLVRTAGADDEADTNRDGFLSYASETHAVGYGLTFGFALALKLAGVPFVFELVLAVFFGVGATRFKRNERVFSEIMDEFQYFGPSILLGFTPTAVILILLGVPLALPG